MAENQENHEVCSTPLRDEHIRQNAKMVNFAGWFMPVEYIGIRAEHLHVRNHVGLFDVSHMGEIRVTGPKALATLQWLISNDIGVLENGKAQYGLLTNHSGGIVDDLIVYCVEKGNDYLLCVNAANTKKDWDWICANNKGATLKNESLEWGQIAVQGPKAVALVAKVFGADLTAVAPFQFVPRNWDGGLCYLARTGYTGEDGFEIFVPTANTVQLWRSLLENGEEWNAQPIGLGARDTLRTEMKYSLYGQEITDLTNPYEAGLGWVVKPEAKEFIGKDIIVSAREKGLNKKLCGFKMLEKGIPRHGYKVLTIDKQEIGEVTSGTVSPSLGENIGIAYLSTRFVGISSAVSKSEEINFAEVGQEIYIDIRGRAAKAIVTKTPFVQTELTKKNRK